MVHTSKDKNIENMEYWSGKKGSTRGGTKKKSLKKSILLKENNRG